MSGPLPDQTPVVIVKAGAADWLDMDCVHAMVKCGYDPSWFGSYSHVKGKIEAADEKCKQWDDQVRAGGTPSGTPPTPADRFLAYCQSGHMSQDAIWRGAGGRDSPCDNHKPGADGNVTSLAPSMPHAGESNRVGSTHQRITVDEMDEARQTGPPGTPMSPTDVQRCANRTTQTALGGAAQNRPDAPPQDLIAKAEEQRLKREGIEAAGGKAPQMEAEERQLRQAGSQGLQQQSAGQLMKEHDVKPPASAAEQEAAQQKAAECLEEFRKAGLDSMRRQVVEENSTKNKKAAADAAAAETAAAKQRQSDAQARADQATARQKEKEAESKKIQEQLDAHGPLKRDATANNLRAQRDSLNQDARNCGAEARAAQREANQSGAEADRLQNQQLEAERRRDNPTADERCLEAQANRLEGHGGNLPPMTGQVPGRRPTPPPVPGASEVRPPTISE